MPCHNKWLEESKKALIQEIGELNRQAPKGLRSNLPLDVLDENQLFETRSYYKGLVELPKAKSWHEKSEALATFLSSTGANTGKSCGPISRTHADRLSTGEMVCRREMKEPKLILTSEKEFIIQTDKYKQADKDTRLKMVANLHQTFLNQYGIHSDGMKFTDDIRDIEKKLRQEGNGAMAFIMDQHSSMQGHATLAVNLRGDIFHIDNTNFASAIINPLRSYALSYQRKFLAQNPNYSLDLPLPDNVGHFWYGILKDKVLPDLCQENAIQDSSQELVKVAEQTEKTPVLHQSA